MEIIGHKIQWKFLKKLAKRDKVPQALLFTGVDSVGKRKIALEFIKLLNCQEKDFCLLYTSPSPRDLSTSRMPSSA